MEYMRKYIYDTLDHFHGTLEIIYEPIVTDLRERKVIGSKSEDFSLLSI